MTWIADAALWSALVLAGLSTGLLASRWSTQATALDPRAGFVLLLAAGAAVVSWSAQAGLLLASAAPPPLLTAAVPVDVAPGYRLAVLWATVPGAAITVATSLLVAAAFLPGRDGATRQAAALSSQGTAMLAVAVWLAPAAHHPSPQSLPAFVQSAGAAWAPLLALVSLTALALALSAMLAPSNQERKMRPALLVAWLAASVSIGAEQLARVRLGIGPRDAVVLGSAASGLVLWLLASLLVHRLARRRLTRVREATSGTARRRAALIAHAGAGAIGVSIAAHAVAARTTVSLPPGGAVSVSGAFGTTWTLVNQGISRFDAEGVDVTALAIEALSPSGRSALLTTELRDYHARNGEHLDAPAGVRGSLTGPLQELRVLLQRSDTVDVASVRVTFLPVPWLWPAGILALVASAAVLVALRDEGDTLT